MQVKITLDTSNAAFQESGEGYETARILRLLANRLEAKFPLVLLSEKIKLFDDNGNTIGFYRAKRGE